MQEVKSVFSPVLLNFFPFFPFLSRLNPEFLLFCSFLAFFGLIVSFLFLSCNPSAHSVCQDPSLAWGRRLSTLEPCWTVTLMIREDFALTGRESASLVPRHLLVKFCQVSFGWAKTRQNHRNCFASLKGRILSEYARSTRRPTYRIAELDALVTGPWCFRWRPRRRSLFASSAVSVGDMLSASFIYLLSRTGNVISNSLDAICSFPVLPFFLLQQILDSHPLDTFGATKLVSFFLWWFISILGNVFYQHLKLQFFNVSWGPN